MVALNYRSHVDFHVDDPGITTYSSPVEFFPDYETLANILLQYDVVKWSFDFIYSITENMIIYENDISRYVCTNGICIPEIPWFSMIKTRA